MITFREHTGPVELRAMQALASRVSPVTGYRHPGDLAWNAGLEHEARTAVWGAGEDVVAWAWLITEPEELMAQVDPAYPDLAEEVLDWARASAVEACDTETALVDALTRRGYAPTAGPFMVCLRRPLADLPPVPELPAGYRLHPATDVARRAAVHRAAFGSERLHTERYYRLTQRWPYRVEFDLTVSAPSGDYAAYCQGWYDETTGIGEFEPVGTHPDHRRRGLAGAVTVAVLHAFAAAGGTEAFVYARGDAAYPAPKALYESLGFTGHDRVLTYRQRKGPFVGD